MLMLKIKCLERIARDFGAITSASINEFFLFICNACAPLAVTEFGTAAFGFEFGVGEEKHFVREGSII